MRRLCIILAGLLWATSATAGPTIQSASQIPFNKNCINLIGDSLVKGDTSGMGGIAAYWGLALVNSYSPSRIYINQGLDGNTTTQILTAFNAQPNWRNCITIIEGGTNDVSQGVAAVATFTGSISGTTLNVPGAITGSIVTGQTLTDAGSGIALGTTITGNIDATDWTVSISQTVVSEAMTASLQTTATFTASISGTTMMVSAVGNYSVLKAGQFITDGAAQLVAPVSIVNQVSGTPDGVGVYTVSSSQTVTSEAMQTAQLPTVKPTIIANLEAMYSAVKTAGGNALVLTTVRGYQNCANGTSSSQNGYAIIKDIDAAILADPLFGASNTLDWATMFAARASGGDASVGGDCMAVSDAISGNNPHYSSVPQPTMATWFVTAFTANGW
jgi:hypothetical protein